MTMPALTVAETDGIIAQGGPSSARRGPIPIATRKPSLTGLARQLRAATSSTP